MGVEICHIEANCCWSRATRASHGCRRGQLPRANLSAGLMCIHVKVCLANEEANPEIKRTNEPQCYKTAAIVTRNPVKRTFLHCWFFFTLVASANQPPRCGTSARARELSRDLKRPIAASSGRVRANLLRASSCKLSSGVMRRDCSSYEATNRCQ